MTRGRTYLACQAINIFTLAKTIFTLAKNTIYKQTSIVFRFLPIAIFLGVVYFYH